VPPFLLRFWKAFNIHWQGHIDFNLRIMVIVVLLSAIVLKIILECVFNHLHAIGLVICVFKPMTVICSCLVSSIDKFYICFLWIGLVYFFMIVTTCFLEAFSSFSVPSEEWIFQSVVSCSCSVPLASEYWRLSHLGSRDVLEYHVVGNEPSLKFK
jgi:hypothetical protein